MVNVIRLRYVLFAGSPGEPRCSQFVVCLEALLSLVCAGKERKKENRQPKGGMGGRYAATTQGF